MNLRKDHCRDPNGRSRTRQRSRGGRREGGRSGRPNPATPGPQCRPRPASLRDGRREQYPARWAPRNTDVGERRTPVPARGAILPYVELLRLSATDILALASMKNVAKCDTWCELQNPVNHRVFERKLRPRLSGRGHACLGITPRVAPRTPTPPAPGRRRARTRRLAPRASRRGGPKCGPPAGTDAASGGRTRTALNAASGPRPQRRMQRNPRRARLGTRSQVRRGHPLSLSISISGGEETYQDSPSNGERTGKSPAWESGGRAARIVVWRSVLSDGPGPSPLERGAREGESPVRPGPCRTTRRCRRVGLFGNAAPIGR